MIKRIKKISALLAFAATVTCCASFTAADASTKLNTKEGNIINAVAYDKGNMMFYGYKNDDDDTSLYYDTRYDYKEVKDSSLYYYDDMIKYGKNYITAVKDDEDSNTEETYLVDLSNGKIDEDESVEDKMYKTAASLKVKLSKTDRYKNIDMPEIIDFQNNSFGEKWYMYTTEPGENSWDKDEAAGLYFNNKAHDYKEGQLFGFVNEKGNYIDITHRAEVYAYSSELGKMVYMDDFNSKGYTDLNEDGIGEKSNVTAKLAYDMGVVAEDKDYIYSMIGVNFEGDESLEGTTKTYIQKVSKKQGDKVNGAYVPFTVECYEISNKFSSAGAVKAAELFDGSGSEYKSALYGQFSVKNGQLYLTQINENGDKVRVTKINLQKDSTNIDGHNVDAYLAEADNGVEQSISKYNACIGTDGIDFTNMKECPVSKDVDNNIWALDNGTIYKFDGEKFKKQFICDNTFNKLDVYNSKNLIVWNSDYDTYASLQDGKN